MRWIIFDEIGKIFAFLDTEIFRCGRQGPMFATVNNMSTDDLTTQGASASTTMLLIYQISNIRRTFAGNQIVDHSDVAGASPIGAAPTTSSFST